MHNYCTSHIIKANFENFLIHRCNYILLSQVYCVSQVVKTPTVISNNPVELTVFIVHLRRLAANTIRVFNYIKATAFWSASLPKPPYHPVIRSDFKRYIVHPSGWHDVTIVFPLRIKPTYCLSVAFAVQWEMYWYYTECVTNTNLRTASSTTNYLFRTPVYNQRIRTFGKK
jgi:hypothetical protein